MTEIERERIRKEFEEHQSLLRHFANQCKDYQTRQLAKVITVDFQKKKKM